MSIAEKCLVVFSGGQDSTTCLGWALERFDRVATIGFDYGQRHEVEMKCRLVVREGICTHREDWAKRLGPDWTTRLDMLKEIGGTALTEEMEICLGKQGLPNTFVPGRNLLFLSAATAFAYRQGIAHIVLGVCETDFSGYPDCRDNAIKAMQVALSIGMDTQFAIHTPLMWLNKAQTWKLAKDTGGDAFVDLILEHTHTCYLGNRSIRHDWGYGCGTCPACELRAAGYTEYKANQR